MRYRTLGIVALLLRTAVAHAHSFESALLELREREPGIFDVVWRPPGRESGAVMPGDPALVPRLPAACRERGRGGESAERVAFQVDCGPGRLRGATIAVPGIAGSRVDAIVRLTWNDGDTVSGVLRSDGEEFVVPEGPSAGTGLFGASAGRVARRYGRLGAERMLRGYDHVLFLTGLVLLVGPTRRLVATLAAFTLAHSLTLTAATVGLISLPPGPVAASIALGIVLLARELLRGADEPPTLTRRFPWTTAFTFGLLHGLAFASALVAAGVPADHAALALVAFNLGIEAGALGIVGLLAVGGMAVRRGLVVFGSDRRLPAYAMGSIAVAWTIERILRFWHLPT
jgi:HupE / UreJ protein